MDTSALKARLVQFTSNDWEKLRQLSLYYAMRGQLRQDSWLNLVLGAFTLWLGLSRIEYGYLYVVQALGGGVTILVSLIGLAQSNARSVQLFSGLFFAAGAWNLFVTFQSNPGSVNWLVLILALLQFWWAAQSRKRFQLYQELDTGKPAALTDEYTQLCDAMNKGEFADDTRYLEMRINRRMFRGLMMSEYIFLIAKGLRRFMLVIPKQNFILFSRKSPGVAKPLQWHEVAIIYGQGQKGIAHIRSLFFSRYLDWNGNQPLALDTMGLLMRTLQIRQSIRVLSVVILILIVVPVVLLVLLALQNA